MLNAERTDSLTVADLAITGLNFINGWFSDGSLETPQKQLEAVSNIIGLEMAQKMLLATPGHGNSGKFDFNSIVEGLGQVIVEYPESKDQIIRLIVPSLARWFDADDGYHLDWQRRRAFESAVSASLETWLGIEEEIQRL